MVLLVLIALAQLAVSVVILAAVLSDQPGRLESETALANERIRSVEHQTIEAMLAVTDDAAGPRSRS